ncbi:MAG: hypothetical protein HY392_05025 [Candidatus Diapherotrites archaeon]|nr:hypothetical protein [Candidatus Diapherotrites archaeon]
MAGNGKAWFLAIIFGLIGIVISAAVFFGIMVATERVFGLVAIFTGAIAGGIAALGFKLGGGSFKEQKDVSNFLLFATIIGFLAVVAGFVVSPYFYLGGFGRMEFGTFIELYSSLGGFSPIDLLFVAIGAFGGRWAGQKVGYSIAVAGPGGRAMDKSRVEGLAGIDKKFK